MLLSNPTWFFYGQLYVIPVHHKNVKNANRVCTIFHNITFALAFLATIKTWLPPKHISPGDEAWKVKAGFLKTSYWHTNDLSSPKTTNTLLETGQFKIAGYLKEEKFFIAFIICDLQVNFKC